MPILILFHIIVFIYNQPYNIVKHKVVESQIRPPFLSKSRNKLPPSDSLQAYLMFFMLCISDLVLVSVRLTTVLAMLVVHF